MPCLRTLAPVSYRPSNTTASSVPSAGTITVNAPTAG
jgi:hypothetical protein